MSGARFEVGQRDTKTQREIRDVSCERKRRACARARARVLWGGCINRPRPSSPAPSPPHRTAPREVDTPFLLLGPRVPNIELIAEGGDFGRVGPAVIRANRVHHVLKVRLDVPEEFGH